MSHADGLQAMADGCEIQKNWIPSWNKYKETIDPGTMQCDIYAAGYYTARRELQDLIDRQVEQLKAKDTALEEIRVGIGRDTTSVQWIEKRAEQGLEGKRCQP